MSSITPESPDPERLVDVNEAARLLRLSKSSLYKLTAARRIAHFKLGGRLLFDPADLGAYLLNHRVEMR